MTNDDAIDFAFEVLKAFSEGRSATERLRTMISAPDNHISWGFHEIDLYPVRLAAPPEEAKTKALAIKARAGDVEGQVHVDIPFYGVNSKFLDLELSVWVGEIGGMLTVTYCDILVP